MHKFIWLDSDTMVLKNLGKFFDADTAEYYVAGVRGTNEGIMCKKWGIVLEKYINVGSFLLNLDKIREENLEYKFCLFIEKNISLKELVIIEKGTIDIQLCNFLQRRNL